MAKRTRYQNRTASRPVKRPARPAGSGAEPEREPDLPAEPIGLDTSIDAFEDMPARSSSGLTDAELRRAEQLEAEATARERAAIAASLRREAARGEEGDHLGPREDLNQPLSVRMAHEYAYVARDVRRFLLTGGLMVGILAVLAVLINVAGVIKL
jgi:hypothetical protein